MNILSVSDDVELGDFVLRVRDDVQVFKNFDVGSYKTVSFSVPSKVERVCFFNPAFRVTARGVSDLLRAAVETSTQENVFIEPFDGFTKTTYFIEDLWAGQEENPLCFATKGRLSFTLETTLQNDDIVVAVGRLPPS